ncbi:MAG: UDP-2,3-diacylglucosamine diphosphatase [Ignavibacteriae bacterium]|nr:UDP-2,3-diacylglucosamine diphosphatase [Ignavibacteriota bacterium]
MNYFILEKVDTIIISDVHLGSEVARPRQILEMLTQYTFDRLILLGDIFDNLNFARLKKNHWNLLSYIRKLSNPKRNTEVIWVEGNHDDGLAEIMSHLIGIDVYKEYAWSTNGKKYLAIHGHQFDRFLNENFIISAIASFIYDRIQRWGNEKQTVARFLKNKSKGWLRLAKKVADGAVEYGRHRNADIVICGHTHKADMYEYPEKNMVYYNSGCWTDLPSSYILIYEGGKTEIKYFDK